MALDTIENKWWEFFGEVRRLQQKKSESQALDKEITGATDAQREAVVKYPWSSLI